MDPTASLKFIEAINKSSQLIAKAFQTIYNLSNDYLKLSNEEDRKERERNKQNKFRKQDQPFFPEKKEEKPAKPIEGKRKQEKNRQANLGLKKLLSDGSSEQEKKVKANILDKKISKRQEKKDDKGKDDKGKDDQSDKQPQKKEKQVRMQKPKMPVSAFLRFNKAHIESVKKQYPHMSQNDMVSVTGHMWSTAKPQLKKKYEQEYAMDKQRYDAAMIEYHRKNPQDKKHRRNRDPNARKK